MLPAVSNDKVPKALNPKTGMWKKVDLFNFLLLQIVWWLTVCMLLLHLKTWNCRPSDGGQWFSSFCSWLVFLVRSWWTPENLATTKMVVTSVDQNHSFWWKPNFFAPHVNACVRITLPLFVSMLRFGIAPRWGSSHEQSSTTDSTTSLYYWSLSQLFSAVESDLKHFCTRTRSADVKILLATDVLLLKRLFRKGKINRFDAWPLHKTIECFQTNLKPNTDSVLSWWMNNHTFSMFSVQYRFSPPSKKQHNSSWNSRASYWLRSAKQFSGMRFRGLSKAIITAEILDRAGPKRLNWCTWV